MGGFDHRSGWAGTIWLYSKEGRGRAGWEDLPQPTPELAFERMLEAAKEHDVTDVREWSGNIDDVVRDAP
jgi:hypothetical protein|tara:strand:+ start:485 stop:694 length:210 start_codon:yes stop_codon:yes gene_type:complete